ncbi:Odorant-binding protein 69a [Drosophila ananassae]|uniref:Odorant-binding protein 69a n=1 Tax=Drosophila ananassae TaxID=7217 RepID=B3M7T2_DROAN|nr:general odorant-binding protein 69a [Drosophila ananassae]EDV38805.1 Odorant-binding protein 69a [Drosophila ananassae]
MATRHLSLLITLLVVWDSVPASHSVIQISPAILKQVRKLHTRCVNQTGADDEMLQQATRDRVMLHDPAFKCFLHCMFDMFGLMDSQNVVHLESLNEVLPEEVHSKINDLVNKCGTQQGKDGCETAYETVKCYLVVNKPFIMDEVIAMIG